MSEHGANRRPHSRRKNQSKGLKPLVILGAILAVVAPIAWILGQETGGGRADASIPYVNRDDDRYSTPDHEIPIVDSTPGDVPSTAPTPTTKPSTPGVTPTLTPTPGLTRTPDRLSTETPVPTTAPTDRPTSTDTVQPTSRPTTTSRPTSTPTETATTSSPKPTPTATETTRTPTDDGGMNNFEFELFSTLNATREDNGCAPLKRSTALTKGARADAGSRANSGDLSGSGASYAAVGGDGMTAKAAMDRLLRNHRETVLNCDLTTLGVGKGAASYQSCTLILFCSTRERVSWVVDFT